MWIIPETEYPRKALIITPLEILKIGFIAFLTVDFIRYARSGKAARHFTVFRGWTWAQWLATISRVLAGLAGVFAIIVCLWPMPLFRFSWLNLLVTPADDPEAGTNLMAAGVQIPWFALVFIPLLALNMPRLARREEEVFRRGTRSVGDAWLRSIRFGLVHMVVGVPLAAAVALILSGWIFTWCYWKGGLRTAAFHHTLHNFAVLTLLAFVLLSGG